MKVWVMPADEGGCGHYRLIWPAEALAAQGHDVELRYDYTFSAVWQPSAMHETDRIVGLAEQVEADVVVFQRPLHRNRVELIDALQAQGVAVVVECDDDFHSVHRRNAAWRGSNPLSDPDKNRDWLMRACDRADLVTVSTPALAARYGSHGRVAVLRNCVPASYLSIRPGLYTEKYLTNEPARNSGHQPGQNKGRNRETAGQGARALGHVTVGWSGSVYTHPGDLETTGGGVAAAVRGTGARFEVVGTGKAVLGALGLDVEPAATGWLPIEAYPEALARFDIGIVPLLDSPFNAAKSALKMMEYAAVGVAPVGSPSPENVWLHDQGVGLIASTPDEWFEHVARLVVDAELRAEVAARSRAVVAGMTIEANATEWADAWAAALEHRDARAAA